MRAELPRERRRSGRRQRIEVGRFEVFWIDEKHKGVVAEPLSFRILALKFTL